MTAEARPATAVDVIVAGEPSWTEVHLVDVADGDSNGDATALRSGLEAYGVSVRLTRVAQARHLVHALSKPQAPFVLLSGHGENGVLLLPSLSEELDLEQPYRGGSVTAADLREFAVFNGATVISTACETGSPEMVEAVLACGASAFIAPTGQPQGNAAFFAVMYLFYEASQLRSLEDAVQRLAAHDGELAMWRLHRR